MKYFIFITLLMFFSFSCRTPNPPDWQLYSVNYIKRYQNSFLEGNDSEADIYFEKALEYIKNSGNVDQLSKAWIFRCSLEQLSLSDSNCSHLSRFNAVSLSKKDLAYISFIKAEDVVKTELLPKKHRKFYKKLNASPEKINREIFSDKSDISKILMASIAVRKNVYNEETLLKTYKTASRMGWKKVVVVFMKKHAEYLKSHGNHKDYDILRKKIEIISN
ncbi:MAG: hypothetical protein R6W70_01170 [bacterium]